MVSLLVGLKLLIEFGDVTLGIMELVSIILDKMKGKIPEKLRIIVLDRDKHKCLWCGRGTVEGVTLDVDHILAEHWGGKTTEDNLGTLCLHCNRSKQADYYGSYLLSTIFKIKNFEYHFEEIFKRDTRRDGELHGWKIEFYNAKNNVFLPELIEHEYFIDEIFLITKGTPDTDIKIEDKRKEALLNFKDKIRDYLFEKKGFLEESEDKLVFRHRE